MMKRGFAQFSKDEPVKRASCTSCKKRKLKCDRALPCSNCVLRKVECLSPERSLRVSSERGSIQQRTTRSGRFQPETSHDSGDSAHDKCIPTPDGTTDDYTGVESNANIAILPKGFGSRYHYPLQNETPAALPLDRTSYVRGVTEKTPASALGPRYHHHVQHEKSTALLPERTEFRQNPLQKSPATAVSAENQRSGEVLKHKQFYDPRQQRHQSTGMDSTESPNNGLPTPESSVAILDALNTIPDSEHQPHDLSRCALSLEADATGMKLDISHDPSITALPNAGIKLTFPASDAYGQGPITRPEVQRCLPPRSKALRLLDHYADLIQWIYHVCHMPSLRRSLHNLFDTLATDAPIDMSELALISAVLGVSAYNFPETPQKPTEAMQALAVELVRLSQRALAEANYLRTPNIATVQADLILGYAIFPEAGEMPTTLLALRASIHCAQSLGMHRVDSPREKKLREGKKVDHVKLETMRRIWWRLVSSDW